MSEKNGNSAYSTIASAVCVGRILALPQSTVGERLGLCFPETGA